MKSVDSLEDLLYNLNIRECAIREWVKPTGESITTSGVNKVVLDWNAAKLFGNLLEGQKFLQGRFALSDTFVVFSYGLVHHKNELVSEFLLLVRGHIIFSSSFSLGHLD